VNVGHELRHARERQDMSLQQLSRITKISPRVLQVLEASDENRLPARVFTRAFVRSYALEVGLDPDDIVPRYFEQFQDTAPAIPPEIERPPEPPPRAISTAGYLLSAGRMLQGRFGTASVLTSVVVTIVVLAMQRREAPSSGASAPQPPAVATAGFAPATQAQPAAVGTSGSTPAAVDALHIVVAPTGPCWMQATVNAIPVFAGMLNAGDRRTIDAPSEVTLRVGDPSTLAFTINGRPARITGAPAQAVTVRITRDNYTQFLAR
jgi:cytoskeleton protein RodZ